MMQKKTVFTLLIWLASTLLIAQPAMADATLEKIKKRQKIVIGVDGISPPFGILDPVTGKLGGFQYDLGMDIAKRLGVALEVVSVTPSTRVQFLQAGKVDLLIANIQWTQERSEILSYAQTPYNMVGGAALVSKNSGIHKWEDLRGKVACVSQGSNFTKPLQEKYGAIVKGLRGIPESLLALRGGVCDASVHVQPALYETLHGEQALEWAAFELASQDQLIPSPTVIWTRRNETDTTAWVNEVIRQWHQSGSLQVLSEKYGVPDEYMRAAKLNAEQGLFDAAPPQSSSN